MIRPNSLCVLASAILLAGCVSPTPPDEILDSTPRKRNPGTVLLHEPPTRPFKIIAKLYSNADLSKGTSPVSDVLRKAENLGADAVIVTTSARKGPTTVVLGDASTPTYLNCSGFAIVYR